MSRSRRAWRLLDRFCTEGVDGVRRLLGLAPSESEHLDEWTEARLRHRSVSYERLVRDVAASQGHRPTEVANAFGGYRCGCNLSSWSHSAEYGPLGGCPVGWPAARRAVKRHHDFGHRHNLDFGPGAGLCATFGCEEDDCPDCGHGPCRHFPTAT